MDKVIKLCNRENIRFGILTLLTFAKVIFLNYNSSGQVSFTQCIVDSVVQIAGILLVSFLWLNIFSHNESIVSFREMNFRRYKKTLFVFWIIVLVGDTLITLLLK